MGKRKGRKLHGPKSLIQPKHQQKKRARSIRGANKQTKEAGTKHHGGYLAIDKRARKSGKKKFHPNRFPKKGVKKIPQGEGKGRQARQLYKTRQKRRVKKGGGRKKKP